VTETLEVGVSASVIVADDDVFRARLLDHTADWKAQDVVVSAIPSKKLMDTAVAIWPAVWPAASYGPSSSIHGKHTVCKGSVATESEYNPIARQETSLCQ
jgi:hypothetical protein